MSNIERVENLKQIVMQSETDFNLLAQVHGAVRFAREASFALEILKNSSYLMEVAFANQDSLKRAVLNVAAIGLSLNPVHKLAYLVPRDKSVCLDISYRGFVQLATDVGAIKFAHAELVCEKDAFQLMGLGEEPLHKFEPFADRGPIVGAYCVAKTHDGEFLTTVMPISEIHSIRDRSQSWISHKTKGKSSPWNSDESEMIKKTVIRRAYKGWPMTDTRKRFDEAVSVTSDFDPDAAPVMLPPVHDAKAEQVAMIRSLLKTLDRTEANYVEYLVRSCRRDVKQIEDLTPLEINQQIALLNSFVAKKNAFQGKETA